MTDKDKARWAMWLLPIVTGIIVGLTITFVNQKIYGAQKLWDEIDEKLPKSDFTEYKLGHEERHRRDDLTDAEFRKMIIERFDNQDELLKELIRQK